MFHDPSWMFESVDDLLHAQRTNHTSIGVVVPKEITKLEILPRSADERRSFEEKFQDLKLTQTAKAKQLDMFQQAIPTEMRRLAFLRARVQISWQCGQSDCQGHRMQVLDWEFVNCNVATAMLPPSTESKRLPT